MGESAPQKEADLLGDAVSAPESQPAAFDFGSAPAQSSEAEGFTFQFGEGQGQQPQKEESLLDLPS